MKLMICGSRTFAPRMLKAPTSHRWAHEVQIMRPTILHGDIANVN